MKIFNIVNLLATQIKQRGGMDDGGKKENQSKMMQVMSTWEDVEETFKVGDTHLKI